MRLTSIASIVASLTFTLGAPASAAPPAPAASLTGAAECNGGGWLITWTLTTSGTGGANAVLSQVAFTHEVVSIPPGVSPPPAPTLGIFVDHGTIAGDGVFTARQPLSPSYPSAELAFTLTWHLGETTSTRSLRATATAPTGCLTPTPVMTNTPNQPPPTTVEEPGDPLPSPTPTWTPRPPTEKPLPATTGPVAPSASPTPSSTEAAPVLAADDTTTGGSSGLARTGAAVAGVAGLAAVLIAAGLALFFATRRRRQRFTA